MSHTKCYYWVINHVHTTIYTHNTKNISQQSYVCHRNSTCESYNMTCESYHSKIILFESHKVLDKDIWKAHFLKALLNSSILPTLSLFRHVLSLMAWPARLKFLSLKFPHNPGHSRKSSSVCPSPECRCSHPQRFFGKDSPHWQKLLPRHHRHQIRRCWRLAGWEFFFGDVGTGGLELVDLIINVGC